MKIKRFYKGFSTRNYENKGGNFDIYNIECVEEDLLNEIFTSKGSRLDIPNFGTRIPDLIFEINDTEAAEIVREDLLEVVNHDPRVRLESMDVVQHPDRNSMIAMLKLHYIEFVVTKDLYIEINSQ